MPTNETPSAGAGATSYSKLINACENSGHERPIGYPCAKCIVLALDAFARERAHWRCDLCHCCGEKRHDGGDPCVSCESTAREREAAVWEEAAKIVDGSAEFDSGDSGAQVAIRSGITKSLAAALRARAAEARRTP